jgi:hypothetical protein
VSRQSPATSALPPRRRPLFRGNSFIEPRASYEVIHRFSHRFHPLRYSCILQYRRLSPASPKKGDSLSDPSSFGLQSSTPSASSNQLPQVYSRVTYRSNVSLAIKRGIVSAYPIYAFALDPPSRSPKHFAQNILVRRPSPFIDARYSFSRFNSRLKVIYRTAPTPPFFFQASSLGLSSCSRYIESRKLNHANRTFCSNSCSPLESRQELACATSGRRC